MWTGWVGGGGKKKVQNKEKGENLAEQYRDT